MPKPRVMTCVNPDNCKPDTHCADCPSYQEVLAPPACGEGCSHPEHTRPVLRRDDGPGPVLTDAPVDEGVLVIAERLIHGDRARQHGPASETFDRAAAIAKGMGVEISTKAILRVMIALKLARAAYNPDNRDNLIDAARYIGLLDEAA